MNRHLVTGPFASNSRHLQDTFCLQKQLHTADGLGQFQAWTSACLRCCSHPVPAGWTSYHGLNTAAGLAVACSVPTAPELYPSFDQCLLI